MFPIIKQALGMFLLLVPKVLTRFNCSTIKDIEVENSSIFTVPKSDDRYKKIHKMTHHCKINTFIAPLAHSESKKINIILCKNMFLGKNSIIYTVLL